MSAMSALGTLLGAGGLYAVARYAYLTHVIEYSEFRDICLIIASAMVTMVLWLAEVVVRTTLVGGMREAEWDRVAYFVMQTIIRNLLFILYVLLPRDLPELLFWLSWLSVVVFFKVLVQFCNLRVEQVSTFPLMPQEQLRKVALLVFFTLSQAVGFLALHALAFHSAGASILLFILYEPVDLILEAFLPACKFSLYVLRNTLDTPVEEFCYIADCVVELLRLLASLAYHGYVLAHFISVSLSYCLLLFHLRSTLRRLGRRATSMRNYFRVLRLISETYKTPTLEALMAYGDPCAICYDVLLSEPKPLPAQGLPRLMQFVFNYVTLSASAVTTSTTTSSPTLESACGVSKVLPCGHIFHLRCIRQWMEHKNACPICKHQLLLAGTGTAAASRGTSHPLSLLGHDVFYINWLLEKVLRVLAHAVVGLYQLLTYQSQLNRHAAAAAAAVAAANSAIPTTTTTTTTTINATATPTTNVLTTSSSSPPSVPAALLLRTPELARAASLPS